MYKGWGEVNEKTFFSERINYEGKIHHLFAGHTIFCSRCHYQARSDNRLNLALVPEVKFKTLIAVYGLLYTGKHNEI